MIGGKRPSKGSGSAKYAADHSHRKLSLQVQYNYALHFPNLSLAVSIALII